MQTTPSGLKNRLWEKVKKNLDTKRKSKIERTNRQVGINASYQKKLESTSENISQGREKQI